MAQFVGFQICNWMSPREGTCISEKLVSALACRCLFTVSSCACGRRNRTSTSLTELRRRASRWRDSAGIAARNDYDDPTSYAIGCPIGIGVGAPAGVASSDITTLEAGASAATAAATPPPLLRHPPPPVRQKLVLRGVAFRLQQVEEFGLEIAAVLDEAASTLRPIRTSRLTSTLLRRDWRRGVQPQAVRSALGRGRGLPDESR